MKKSVNKLYRYYIGVPIENWANSDKNIMLPISYNGCQCDCHKIPGVKHIIPCCFYDPDTDLVKR